MRRFRLLPLCLGLLALAACSGAEESAESALGRAVLTVVVGDVYHVTTSPWIDVPAP